MKSIVDLLDPKLILSILLLFISLSCQSQQGLDFKSRQFKKAQTYSFEDIKDNISFDKSVDKTYLDKIHKTLDTLYHKGIEKLNLGKQIAKHYNVNLVGNLDSLDSYNKLLKSLVNEYKLASINKTSKPDEYAEVLIKANKAITDFETVVALALKKEVKSEANGIPQIDGINSRISPSINIAGEFHFTEEIDVKGNVFIGNDLSDTTNFEAIYNPNSSTFGVNLAGSVKLRSFWKDRIQVFGNFRSVFTEKSIYRDSISDLNFHMIDSKLGLEVSFFNGFALYWGKNFVRPLNEIEEFEKVVAFKSDQEDESYYQSFSNVGFRGQYALTKDKDFSIAFDVNALLLNDDLKSTLNTKDPVLLILKLSINKNL